MFLSRSGNFIVSHDKSYFFQDQKNLPGRKFNQIAHKTPIPFKYKNKLKEKFFKKYLVSRAKAADGAVSKRFISEGTMTGNVGKMKCVNKILVPFIM